VEREQNATGEIDPGMTLLDIFTFSGRLHPLVVHLPIGFILLATVFDLLAYSTKYSHLRQAVSVTLFFGFVAAVLACTFGYILSLSGDYEKKTLSNHQFSGILLAVIAGLLFYSTTAGGDKVLRIPRKLFSVFMVMVIGLVSYAGHQGANLTHGNDYLTLQTLLKEERKKPDSVEHAMIYEDVVHPILEKKCAPCHRDGKMKGNLSVETLKSLLKGGKAGPAVVPGKPEEGELYKRVTLDPDHEDYMPADGKPPLTKNEVALIRWWIAKAGATQGKLVTQIQQSDSIKPAVARYLGLAGPFDEEDNKDLSRPVNPDIPLAVNVDLIDSLKRKGLMVRMMQLKPAMLDVTLPSGSGVKADIIKNELIKVGRNIIWLNLSGNNFNDKDLDFLAAMQNLEKLRIENNPVGADVCRYLVGLKHLESVNLNNTKVNKEDISVLKKNPAIKRVYVWKGRS